MIFGVLNPDINSLYICPSYLYTAATLPWEIQKKSFFNCIIHTYPVLQIIYVSTSTKSIPKTLRETDLGWP